MKPPVYIWQHPDWPSFSWDYEAVLPFLSDIHTRQGRLAASMAFLGFDVAGYTGVGVLTEDIISSSAIEGVMLNPESVRSSVARKLGLEVPGMVAADHYVEGLVDVMIDAVNNTGEPLTAERLFGWHAALFPTGYSGHSRITVANWRAGHEAMQVVSGAMGHEKVHFEAPPSNCVPGMMSDFLNWTQTEVADDIIGAAVAHLWFVTVHPFDDGNGRLARTIADYFLSRADGLPQRFYSMSAEILRRKKEYYLALEKAQKGAMDITEWIRWFLECLQGALTRAEAIVERTLSKARFWARHNLTPVNERQRKILNRLWDGLEGKLSTSKYAKMCRCSQDTALRDINDLIAKGMLKDSGEGGRSKNYLLVE